MYIGCYSNSKTYTSNEKAKEYCLCTINKLSEKYSDKEIDLIFKKNHKRHSKQLSLHQFILKINKKTLKNFIF